VTTVCLLFLNVLYLLFPVVPVECATLVIDKRAEGSGVGEGGAEPTGNVDATGVAIVACAITASSLGESKGEVVVGAATVAEARLEEEDDDEEGDIVLVIFPKKFFRPEVFAGFPLRNGWEGETLSAACEGKWIDEPAGRGLDKKGKLTGSELCEIV